MLIRYSKGVIVTQCVGLRAESRKSFASASEAKIGDTQRPQRSEGVQTTKEFSHLPI